MECSYEARKTAKQHTHTDHNTIHKSHMHTHICTNWSSLNQTDNTDSIRVYRKGTRDVRTSAHLNFTKTLLKLSTHNTTKYGYVHSSFSLSLISHNFMRSFEVISPALIYGTQSQIKDLIINICLLTLCKPGTPILTPSLLTRYQVMLVSSSGVCLQTTTKYWDSETPISEEGIDRIYVHHI